MRSHFLSLKIIAIVILVAIFWIGLFFITSLVSERHEPYQVCRRVNILRDYADEKTKLYPRN